MKTGLTAACDLLAIPSLRISVPSLLAASSVVLQSFLAIVHTHMSPRPLRVGEHKETMALLRPGGVPVLAPCFLVMGRVPAGQMLLACFVNNGKGTIVVPWPLNAALKHSLSLARFSSAKPEAEPTRAIQ